jgi:hypothetical protein
VIECWYCTTRNNEDAPTCQACGGPLEGKPEGKAAINRPIIINTNFLSNGSTRPGVTCEEFYNSIREVMRMW